MAAAKAKLSAFIVHDRGSADRERVHACLQNANQSVERPYAAIGGMLLRPHDHILVSIRVRVRYARSVLPGIGVGGPTLL